MLQVFFPPTIREAVLKVSDYVLDAAAAALQIVIDDVGSLSRLHSSL